MPTLAMEPRQRKGPKPVGNLGTMQAAARAKSLLSKQLAGINASTPGLMYRLLERIGKDMNSSDPQISGQAQDRVIKLLPYVMPKEMGETGLEAAIRRTSEAGGSISITLSTYLSRTSGQQIDVQGGQVEGG